MYRLALIAAFAFQVSFARPSSESIKYSNLYISNLPRSVSEQELEALFAEFGLIISSKLLCNGKAGRNVRRAFIDRAAVLFIELRTALCVVGASKSVGFIRFDQRSEAEIAISKLNGTIPKGHR
jgi:ELAV like protein 2/3/4